MSPTVRTLFITWQEPESRRIFPIARLMRLADGAYEFSYIEAVSEAETKGFTGLPDFEDLTRVYVSAELPALFEQRLRPRARQTEAEDESMRESLDAAPVTILVPVGEGKTERLEVFAPPLPTRQGAYFGVFAARGVGRVPGSTEAVERLEGHARVTLMPEPDNAYNPRALRIVSAEQESIGYVPDYLANELHAVGGKPERLQLEISSVTRINYPPAPALYMVLCRYTCSAELGRALFRSAHYKPVSSAAFRPPSAND